MTRHGRRFSSRLPGRSHSDCRAILQGRHPAIGHEAVRLHAQVPNWELRGEARCIDRNFKCKNFGDALAFVQKVGELAEAEGHHPDISFGWGYADVSLQTKKIRGLHENDFIMAAKIDRLAGQAS
jgi:4a-hydroxytetrahydrobiopterin dehydratase